jgi:hypothetical protein
MDGLGAGRRIRESAAAKVWQETLIVIIWKRGKNRFSRAWAGPTKTVMNNVVALTLKA